MNIPANPPAPLAELTPDLRQSLKERVQRNHANLVRKLTATVFYHDSPPLKVLREALGTPGVGTPLSAQDEDVLRHFSSSVPFTNYDAYSPYVARLFKTGSEQCRVADIRDLLAPGLPVFVAHSSGTSGVGAKHFFKYPNPLYTPTRWDSPEAHARMGHITICQFTSIRLREVVSVPGDESDVVQVPVTLISAGGIRAWLGIGPTDDEYIADKKAAFFTSPFAAWLLPSYTSCMYMNGFFGVLNGSVAFMTCNFSTILYDAIHIIEEHWETWIEAIELGKLPDIPNLGEYRAHLQAHLKPNPTRASELRLITKGEEGWLKKIWPNLAIVRVTLSGPYALVIPKLRHHFGSKVSLQSVVCAATETTVGFGYNANDTNLYRLDSDEHIELLDVEDIQSLDNLLQPWEIIQGKKYEVVVTNKDGLWRYLLNDVIEIAGFSPVDGQPLFRYIGRKDVAFRIHSEFVSQQFLQEALISLSQTLGNVTEFSVVLDERKTLRAYGFIVELQDGLAPNAHMALQQLKTYMLLNSGYKQAQNNIGNPTIRIVPPGTFNTFRSWRVETTGSNPSQVKIPIATADAAISEWLVDRVFMDLEVEFGNV